MEVSEQIESPVEETVVNETIEKAEEPKGLRETITEAVEEVKKNEKTRDEKGKFTEKKLELTEDKAEIAKKSIATKADTKIEAPAFWKAEEKQKWAAIAPDVQQVILRREEEVHKGFTKLEEDRALGKQVKETITPYLATIRAEGGTPVTAIADLLNTAHVLRTADPVAKARMVHNVIQKFNVDLSLLTDQKNGQTDQVSMLQQKLAQIEFERQQEKQLREQNENGKVYSQIDAFASDTKNEFFEQVKAHMAALLSAGLAPNLEEAYEAAVMANPSTRALYLQKQSAAAEAKKQEDIAAKKRAAVSISGSSSKSIANAENPNRSLREELEAQFRKSSLD